MAIYRIHLGSTVAAAVGWIVFIGKQHLHVEEVAAVLVSVNVSELNDVLGDRAIDARLSEVGAIPVTD
ncbi:hypothetical protein EAH72_20470 [Pseudomonas caspiana]|nr:hypothetical protein EAH72_20470 [Pseudomonas caspiana]